MQRSSSAARLAASLVVTAGGSGAGSAYNYRVLMVRRVGGGSFGGAHVFPGGVEEAGDARNAERWRTSAAHVCAVRETAEETGVHVALDSLRAIGRWTTPREAATRFDTRFFTAHIGSPPSELSLQAGEVDAADWVCPAAVLRANAGGEVRLLPPQFCILTEMARFTRWQDLRALPDAPHVEPVLCRRSDGRCVALLPGDCAYAPGGAPVPDAGLFAADSLGLNRIVMTPAAGGGFVAACLLRTASAEHA
ncbi:hypothetical protein GGI02_005153 [Coemansia sp. RSA 2322]|nr:hypothetical protein GGI02_005153 [Coemansia sp. RSA 2322]